MSDPTSVKITLPMIYQEVKEIKKEVTGQNAKINRAVILAGTALTIALTLLAVVAGFAR